MPSNNATPTTDLKRDLAELKRDIRFCTNAIMIGAPEPLIELSWWHRRARSEFLVKQIEAELRRRGDA